MDPQFFTMGPLHMASGEASQCGSWLPTELVITEKIRRKLRGCFNPSMGCHPLADPVTSAQFSPLERSHFGQKEQESSSPSGKEMIREPQSSLPHIWVLPDTCQIHAPQEVIFSCETLSSMVHYGVVFTG